MITSRHLEEQDRLKSMAIQFYWSIPNNHAMKNKVEKAGSTKNNNLSKGQFFFEYVRFVCLKGLSEEKILKKEKELRKHINKITLVSLDRNIISLISNILGDKEKSQAIIKCLKLLKSMSWNRFRQIYFDGSEKIFELPMIKQIDHKSFLFALGIDTIRYGSEKDLKNIAVRFGYNTVFQMCSDIKNVSGESLFEISNKLCSVMIIDNKKLPSLKAPLSSKHIMDLMEKKINT